MSMRKAHGLRLQTSIVQDNVPVEVAAGLFVGSIHAAFNVEALKSNKISHVLNLAGSYATFPEDFTYLSLSIRDKEYASLLSCLPIAAIFIDAGLKHGGVLVHCAGGRSRSPAVAMAFLMMKQQMSYAAISAHMKALRPVVSLNVGFDAQLKFLETARGDVFVANQHLLKARLTRLAQQHEDGELVAEIAKKRRQSQPTSSHSPPPPLLKKQSSIEMLASGCDDRGMVGERFPSGFCFSTPCGEGCSKAAAGQVPASSFIPALRSMGTVYGCQNCGESLFCAGAIVHHRVTKLTRQPDAESESTRFLNALRGQKQISSSASAVAVIREEKVVVTARESITRKPLLAKLRLKPHSPTVTIGNGVQSATSSETTTSRRKSASPVLTKPNVNAEGLPKGESESTIELQTLQRTQRPESEESKRTGSATLSSCKASGETKKIAGRTLWRSLTSFKGPRRTAKALIDDKRGNGQTHARSSVLEVQKSDLPAFASATVGQMPAHAVFLKHNAAEWQRCVKQLVGMDKKVPFEVNGGSTIDQLAALLDEDATVLIALNDCKQWFIDPQLWTIDQAATNSEGEIRCPRESCGAVVGEWRWEGSRCVDVCVGSFHSGIDTVAHRQIPRYGCGDTLGPAFMMKRDAVCVLGNMTSQSSELMAVGSNEAYPEY